MKYGLVTISQSSKYRNNMPRNICCIYLLIPLLSIGMWLHFMMASTASATLENSIRPDDDRSVFSGNIRTAVGGTSLSLKSCSSCSSAKPGGVLKKWRIYAQFPKEKKKVYHIESKILMKQCKFTLLGGWMRFLLACAGDRKRLFFEPVYSLKLGLWSGRLNGFVTSDKKFCLEKLHTK